MGSRREGPAQGRRGVKTVRRTLSLGTETDIKLDIQARRHGVNRSTMADRLLSDALRGIVVSFRGDQAGDPPALPTGPRAGTGEAA